MKHHKRNYQITYFFSKDFSFFTIIQINFTEQHVCNLCKKALRSYMYIGVRYFPKDIFPRATSQVTISQVATSQMCNSPSGNFPKVRLGPLRRRALRLGWTRGPSAAARTGGDRALRLGHTWKVTAWEIAHLVPLGKILFRSLGK